MAKFNVGDSVEIIRCDISTLKHRKVRKGKIIHIDGAYISVRPYWTSWEICLYPNEIKKL